MTIFFEKRHIRQHIESLKASKAVIGFVPTMGALHDGHLSLVRQAIDNNDAVIVSIFVNPTQFDNALDLKNYPRTLDEDVSLLRTVSEHICVYAPTANDIYDGNITLEHFEFDGLEYEMEGRFRSGHFNGVGTIVKRLFNIVTPDNAYFGEKDFQQLQIIKVLVKNYKIPVTIIGCPIKREADGLAMSSRNTRLTPTYRDAAPFIYETLQKVKTKFKVENVMQVTQWVENEFAKHALLTLEYFVIADVETLKAAKKTVKSKKYRAFIAVHAGDIRLIDNLSLN